MSRVTLTLPSGPDRVVTRATARLLTGRYRKHTFRAPYGTSWHHAGDGLADPLEVSLVVHVHDASITTAASTVDDIITDLRAATHVSTPLGRFANGGLASVTQTPDALGYRLDAILIAASALLTDVTVRARFARVSVTAYRASVADVGVANGVTYNSKQVTYDGKPVTYTS